MKQKQIQIHGVLVSQINIIGGLDTKVCSFDVDEEGRRAEPWIGSAYYCKQNLDAFLKGGKFNFPSGNGQFYDYGEGFAKKYAGKLFYENLGEYEYKVENEESSTSALKNEKKRVIIYTLTN